MVMPEDIAAALNDGVVLCHLANHVRQQSVGSIHVPSATVVSPFIFFHFFLPNDYLMLFNHEIWNFFLHSRNSQWHDVEGM